MALTDENGVGFNMPVAPAYSMPYGGNFGGGLFGNGGDSWLGILFLIALCNGGFGFGGFGGGYGAMMGMGMMDGFGLYPWLNNSQNINDGFREQMLNTSVNGIQNAVTSGFGDVQTALCGGFAGVNQNISQTGNGIVSAITGAQNALTQQMYSNEIAALERSYAAQTANTAGINGVQAQIAQTGYNTTSGIADLKYTVATENCADRYEAAQNTRDIIDSQTRGTQAILDKLCALELDGVKSQLAQAQRENIGLQNAVNMATMQASQTAQTAQILAGQNNEIDALYSRLKNCPVGTYNVCNPLSSPINSCGCGGYGFANG